MAKLLIVLMYMISIGSSNRLSCSDAQQNQSIDTDQILIVYLSRTSNTKTIAEIIQKNIGGKLVALELVNPYPADYRATVQQVVEENETGFLPPLKTKIENIRQYKMIFIGFPTWGMKLPPPMKSFLHENNLSGKTVIPFNTNDGYGIGSSFETVRALCKNCDIKEGFSIQGGRNKDGNPRLLENENKRDAETKVKKWLRDINLLKETL